MKKMDSPIDAVGGEHPVGGGAVLVAKSGHEASQLCGLLMDVQLGPMNSVDLIAHN